MRRGSTFRGGLTVSASADHGDCTPKVRGGHTPQGIGVPHPHRTAPETAPHLQPQLTRNVDWTRAQLRSSKHQRRSAL